jgi:hypothetical protein
LRSLPTSCFLLSWVYWAASPLQDNGRTKPSHASHPFKKFPILEIRWRHLNYLLVFVGKPSRPWLLLKKQRRYKIKVSNLEIGFYFTYYSLFRLFSINQVVVFTLFSRWLTGVHWVSCCSFLFKFQFQRQEQTSKMSSNWITWIGLEEVY